MHGQAPDPEPATCTVIWIDSREARLARWDGDTVRVARLESDVPSRHRSTAHISYDPAFRHGGAGAPPETGEGHRLEHLQRFLKEVAARIEPDDAVEVIGPGIVHERLAKLVRDDDVAHQRSRTVKELHAGRLSDAQLRARLADAVGQEPPRTLAATATGSPGRVNRGPVPD